MLRRGDGASVVVLPGSGGSLAGAAPLISALPPDATVVTVEHPGLDPHHRLAARYVQVVQASFPHPACKLVVLAISLGGQVAPEMAAMLSELDGWAETEINVYMLDSPAIIPAHDTAHHPRLAFRYIQAKRGEEGNAVNWREVLTGGTVYEVDCRHEDLWGECHVGAPEASDDDTPVL